MHHCRSLRHKDAVVRLILSRKPSIRVFRGSTIRLLHQPSQQSTSQYTSTSSWHLRSRDGAVIRREILHCIHEQLEASKAEVAVGRHEVQNSRALQLKGCLVNLMTHAEQYLKTEDGELAQKALDAFVLTRTTQGSSSSLVKTDPVLAADLVSLTLQAWCHSKAPGGLGRAETLMWHLLKNPNDFMGSSLVENTRVYNSTLATYLHVVTAEWHRQKAPRADLQRVENIITTFRGLVEDKSIPLDWATNALNRVLFVYGKARRPDEALELLTNVLWTSKASYLQPTATSYNNVVFALAQCGRPDDIEWVLHDMMQTYGRLLRKVDRFADAMRKTDTLAQALPNHYAVMPWLKSYSKLPEDDAWVFRAGLDAELALRQIHEWGEEGLVDLANLDMALVWEAIGKAWVHAHGKFSPSGEATDSVPHLLKLWRRASTTAKDRPNNVAATPELASLVLSVLNPIKDWPFRISPLLDDMDQIAHGEQSRTPKSGLSWSQVYRRFYTQWQSRGAAESSLNIWSRLDRLDRFSALEALKKVKLERLHLKPAA